MSFFLLGVQFHHRNQGRDSACSPVLLCLGVGHRELRNGRQIRSFLQGVGGMPSRSQSELEGCQIRRGRLQCGPGAQQGLAFQALLSSFLLLPPSCFPSSLLLLSPFPFSPRAQMEVCRLKTQIPLLRSVTPACWSWSSEKPGAHADNAHKAWHQEGARLPGHSTPLPALG